MPILAMLEGLLSPLHWTLLVAIVVMPMVGIIAFAIWFSRRRDGRR